MNTTKTYDNLTMYGGKGLVRRVKKQCKQHNNKEDMLSIANQIRTTGVIR